MKKVSLLVAGGLAAALSAAAPAIAQDPRSVELQPEPQPTRQITTTLTHGPDFPGLIVDDIARALKLSCYDVHVVYDLNLGDTLMGETSIGTFEVFTPNEAGAALAVLEADCMQ